jgi:NADPH-dependent ferric siderophore reductase
MPHPLAHPSSLALAERLSASAAVARTSFTRRISPTIVEIVLRHPDAAVLAGTPGNDVMVRLEDVPGHDVRRRYSVRAVDPAAGELTLWVTTAHDGPGARWARALAADDPVDLVGPRGKIGLDPLADWHLFVGDTSALGAFYRLAESVEPPGRVIFIVEVDHAEDAVTVELPEGLGVTGIFVDRAGRPGGDPTGLLRGLSALALPPEVGQAYVFVELGVGRVVRSALGDRGLADEQISLKAFWRAGVGNAEHGEPPKE